LDKPAKLVAYGRCDTVTFPAGERYRPLVGIELYRIIGVSL